MVKKSNKSTLLNWLDQLDEGERRLLPIPITKIAKHLIWDLQDLALGDTFSQYPLEEACLQVQKLCKGGGDYDDFSIDQFDVDIKIIEEIVDELPGNAELCRRRKRLLDAYFAIHYALRAASWSPKRAVALTSDPIEQKAMIIDGNKTELFFAISYLKDIESINYEGIVMMLKSGTISTEKEFITP